jgi:hypothetical protein
MRALGFLVRVLGWAVWWLGWEMHRPNPDTLFLLALFSPLLIIPGQLLIVAGKRMMATGTERKARMDSRSPVVYLRSFHADDDWNLGQLARMCIVPSSALVTTREEQLAEVFQDLGPLIAIGRPGQALPAIGARRLYFAEEDWKDKVVALLKRSRLVVLRPGRGQNFWWEVSRVIREVEPNRILFWLPEANREVYEDFCKKAHGYLPRLLPPSEKGAMFVYFDREWVPQLVSGVPLRERFSGVYRSMYRRLEPFFDQNDLPQPRLPPWVSVEAILSFLLVNLILAGIFLLSNSPESSTPASRNAPCHLADPEAIEHLARKITPQVNQESATPSDQVAQTGALRFQNLEDHFRHIRGSDHGGFHFIVGELFQLLKPISIRAVGSHRLASNMTISSEKLSADKPRLRQADLDAE